MSSGSGNLKATLTIKVAVIPSMHGVTGKHGRGVGTGGATGARAPPFLPTSCHVADSTAPTQRARQRALTGDAIGDLYIH